MKTKTTNGAGIGQLIESIVGEARAARDKGEEWADTLVALRAGNVAGWLRCRPCKHDELDEALLLTEMGMFAAALFADAVIYVQDGYWSPPRSTLKPDDELFIRRDDADAHHCVWAFHVSRDHGFNSGSDIQGC